MTQPKHTPGVNMTSAAQLQGKKALEKAGVKHAASN